VAERAMAGLCAPPVVPCAAALSWQGVPRPGPWAKTQHKRLKSLLAPLGW